MPEVKVNNIKLYYETYGQGQPVVFISGFGSDHLGWLEMPVAFSSRYRTVVLDNRGSGQSERPDVPYTIAQMAQDVAALCEELQLGPCHIIGSSMGGIIAQVLAYQYPQAVRSIVLCNSLMRADIRFSLTAQAVLSFIQAKCDPRAVTRNVLGWIYSAHFLEQPGMVDLLIETRMANPHPLDEIGYKNQLHAILNADTTSWIREIKTPTLVLGSDQDIVVSEAHMREMARLIPGAEYYGFTGVGHLPFAERPQEFIQVVGEFLNKHST